MATVIAPAPTYQLTPTQEKQTLSSNYIDLYDYSHVYDADTYKKLHPRYGNGRITGFLKVTGSEMPFASDVIYHAEDGRLHKFVEGGTVTDPGIPLMTTLTPSDVRVGDMVIMSDGNVEQQGVVTNVIDTLNFEFARKGITPVVLGVMNMFVYGSEFKKGTVGFQSGFQWKPDIYASHPQILKETYMINESDMAHISWVTTPQGGNLWYFSESYKTRILFENKIEMTQILNKRADAGSPAALAGYGGMDGLLPIINQRGNVANGQIETLDDMREIIKRLNKQGDCKVFTVWADLNQRLGINDALGGVNGHYAGGADYGVFDNKKDMALYLDFNSWTVGGYTFHVTPWKLLDDPTLLGGDLFDTTNLSCLICPAAKKSVTENGETVAKPFLLSRYRSAGNVNRYMRTKLFGVGGTPIDEDGMKIQYVTERTLQVVGSNEFFAVYRS